jgi:hypothetical protein
VGAVRRRHLIRGLAILVGLNMVVGLVALYAHAGDASAREARSPQAAGATSSSTNSGILAGGHFSKRRGSGTTATSATNPTAPGAPGTPGAAGPPGSDATGTTATTRSGPGSTTSSSAAASATTRGTGAGSGSATSAPPAPGGTGAGAGKANNTTVTTAATAGGNHPGSVSDPAGDTFVDGTTDPVRESRADIVRAGAAYGPGGITFTMQLQQPDDPLQDKSWAADTTFVMWSVDTDADGKPDYDIQLARDGAGLVGVVSHPGDTGPAVCDASGAAYGADGFSATVDPGCLGNPVAFAFRATTYYDTNPKNDNSDVASDVAPNGGLSFPVTRPS